MRKLASLFMTLVMILGIACARAEDTQDNFLVSDWKLFFALGDTTIAELTIFFYEDNTYEMIDEDESKKGSWTFDGETLQLMADNETASLKWDEEAYQFSGEYNGMTITMRMSVEPESEMAETVPAAEMPAGGWTIAEDQTITDDLNNIFFRALDSYQTGTITVAYTPKALLGTQVVAGTNYAVLCRASEINKGSKWVIIYLYRDPEDNATVLSIADVALGI